MFGALLTGMLFTLFMWIGDEFVLDNKNPFYAHLNHEPTKFAG